MGGSAGQLGFHFQNLITIREILVGLKNRNLAYAAVEQRLSASDTRELDIIITSRDNSSKYYEIKSGKQFNNDRSEIQDAIEKLYTKHTDVNGSCLLVISDEISSVGLTLISEIQTIKESRRRSAHSIGAITTLAQLSSELRIPTTPLRHFLNNLEILQENAKRIEIENTHYVQEMFGEVTGNSKEGSTEKDLVNRIRDIIIESIKEHGGIVDIKRVWQEMKEWLTYKLVISNTPTRSSSSNFNAASIQVVNFLNEQFDANLSTEASTSTITSALTEGVGI